MKKISKIKKGLKQVLKDTSPKTKKVSVSKLIPTGSTTFNLECSGRIEGAFALGKIVNLIGDSHSGKCIKNAYILTENGMELIDSIGACLSNGISEYKQNLATSKGVANNTSHFWKEEVNKTLKVKTEKGYSIEGTIDHPIMIFNSNFEFEMKKLKDIQQGDCAVIARGTERFSNKCCQLPIIFPKGTNVKIANIPKYINEKFARLLGYVVADGNISKNQVHISNTKKYVRDDLRIICDSLGMHLNNRGIASKHLQLVISEIFGNPDVFTARNKFVPTCILQSPKSIQAAFLQALMDCDSWGDNKGISYFSASKVLSDQVHLMLLNFGIISTLSEKEGAFDGVTFHDHTYYSVSFYGNELNIYRENIGSNKYELPIKSKYRNSDYDSVPNLVEKMKSDVNALRKKLGWSKNGVCSNYDGKFPRFKFADTVNGSKKMLKEFVSAFSKMPIDLSLYKAIINSEYHFSKITSITNYEKPTTVYDVHIPDSHLFWSNGFISHNTLFALTIFAECSMLPRFDNFRFIYDDVEAANEFDIAYLFGGKVNKRIEQDKRSKTIEDLNDTLARLLEEDDPFIYVLDSFDGLTSEAAMEKDEENRKKREKGNQVKGSYGDGKPKKASEMFSQRVQELHDQGSFLLIVSQTRDNIGFGSMFTPKTRSGGKALKFYSCHEVWLACQKKEKKGARTYITNVKAKITKNKLTGRHGEAEFPILFDYGVDNITSCIKFLINEKIWSGSNKSINSKDFAEKMPMSELIKYIESQDLENDLFQLCQDTYDKIMENLKPNRKRKY